MRLINTVHILCNLKPNMNCRILDYVQKTVLSSNQYFSLKISVHILKYFFVSRAKTHFWHYFIAAQKIGQPLILKIEGDVFSYIRIHFANISRTDKNAKKQISKIISNTDIYCSICQIVYYYQRFNLRA